MIFTNHPHNHAHNHMGAASSFFGFFLFPIQAGSAIAGTGQMGSSALQGMFPQLVSISTNTTDRWKPLREFAQKHPELFVQT